MKMKLAEIKLLLDTKILDLRSVYSQRSQSLIDTFRQDRDTKELEKQNVDYEYGVEELTNKADKLESEILLLKSSLTRANCTTEIDFKLDGRNLTLQEAIIYIKSLRESLNNIKYLGELKETRKTIDDRNSMGNITKGYVEITKPTFKTSVFKDRYEKYKKLITKLEVEISSKNFTIEVEIPDDITE